MRSHYCGGINESHIDQEVTLCGWVHRRRDHGGVIFLDLRDRDGMSQVVVDPDTPESFALAENMIFRHRRGVTLTEVVILENTTTIRHD